MRKNFGKASHDRAYVFLIGEWAKNPNLTEKKLTDLIHANHFDSKYGITVADVVDDINAYTTNSDSVIKPGCDQVCSKHVVHKGISDTCSIEKKFKNRNEYVVGLTKFNQQYKDSSFLDENIEKFAKDNSISLSADHILSIRMDLLLLQMNKKPGSPLCLSYIEEIEVDSGFRMALSERIISYMHLADEYMKFRGILLDLLPEYKREVNMLSQLLATGIVEEMKREKTVSTSFISRYIKRMSDNYGYNEILISEIVNAWCEEYSKYLNK